MNGNGNVGVFNKISTNTNSSDWKILNHLVRIFSTAEVDRGTYRPGRGCRSRRLHRLSGRRIPHSDCDLEAIYR